MFQASSWTNLRFGRFVFPLDVAAGGEVALADLEPQRLEPHAGELGGEPALQAPEVSDAEVALVPGEDEVEDAPGREEPGVGVHRPAVLRHRVGAIIQADVVGGEFDGRGHPGSPFELACTRPEVGVGPLPEVITPIACRDDSESGCGPDGREIAVGVQAERRLSPRNKPYVDLGM
jgi:hypothetical protein